MTIRLPCSKCLVSRDFEIVSREEEMEIHGRTVRFLAHFSRCTTCGNEYETAGQLDGNLESAREVYAQLYESPKPEALVALRSKYGASQKAFGMILGFGELTMNSYEQGSTPDATNRLLLKLADKPHLYRAMYEINKTRIGAIQRRRIETSKGYVETERWSGLDALSSELTSVQMEKIETCAAMHNLSIPRQIAAYVGMASFKDYSSLLAGAVWGEGVTTRLNGKSTAHIGTMQAAV
ncbi:MAG: type II TA system antitoxin MqsA family protein [Candidatus Hydrogenedentales bacterium]